MKEIYESNGEGTFHFACLIELNMIGDLRFFLFFPYTVALSLIYQQRQFHDASIIDLASSSEIYDQLSS
jgi:hypothetical protein